MLYLYLVDQDKQMTELDLQQHNICLNSAWKRAQDRSKWCQLVETAKDAPLSDDDDDDEVGLACTVHTVYVAHRFV